MIFKKNVFIIGGKHEKPILIDVTCLEKTTNTPIIIFCHGYKGFKDWGAWNLMAEAFAKAGFCFIKFNFSHNGGTMEQPIDFPDLEAFGNNNYTKELDDLQSVINWSFENETIKSSGNLNDISLMGHSRGGGIVLLKAHNESRVKKVISLAGVSDFLSRSVTSEGIEDWEKTGVKYVLNGRTKQKMPHYYQFYLDTNKNRTPLNIKKAVSNLKIPHLIIHGDNDTSILINEAENLHKWNPDSSLVIIKNANHVFESKHPWNYNHLPKELKEVVDKSIIFLKR
ncbi:alpha/beta hydrolase family protein [Seonamhaeicola maritimus]|uniref:Alpha/beta fold hydrolase n=1 Tax=Seonamhaeicola maritimus TaxID=2591822 RepID=A0A5C7GIU9_9FLAO|nr:alpha/beta fold hydrolase [Seonamhaeicola maritimus]TXG37301.1 alpha/beta fold hydrolase [Seonamhaeicola maritimus]